MAARKRSSRRSRRSSRRGHRRGNAYTYTVGEIVPRKTRYASLGYAQVARGLWRLFDITSVRPAAVGPHYTTKRELLDDLDRYADDSGHASESLRAR